MLKQAQLIETHLARKAVQRRGVAPAADPLLEQILWELRAGNAMRWACMTPEQRAAYVVPQQV